MKFNFDSCIMCDRVLDLLGFTEYWDNNGDSGDRKLWLMETIFTITDNDQRDAGDYGLVYIPFSPQYFTLKEVHRVNISGEAYIVKDNLWETIHFLHELYDLIWQYGKLSDMEEFKSKCTKENGLKHYIDSYEKYLFK